MLVLSCLWVFRCWKVFVLLFGVFVDEVWWPSCAGLRECTRVGYESALRCHVLPRWGGVDLDSVTVADIESWLDSFAKAGAARKAWAVFRSILRLAFKRGMTDNDVTRREIRLPHLRHYEPQVLSAPEVRRLLKRLLRSRVGSLVIGVRMRWIAPLRVGRRGMGRLGFTSRHRHREKVGTVGGGP